MSLNCSGSYAGKISWNVQTTRSSQNFFENPMGPQERSTRNHLRVAAVGPARDRNAAQLLTTRSG